MNGMVESNLFPDTIYLFIEYIYSTFAEAIDANQRRYVDREIGYLLPCGIPFPTSPWNIPRNKFFFPKIYARLRFYVEITALPIQIK